MYELGGVWYDSADALLAAHPSTKTHDSVMRDISLSPAWAQAKALPQDAAALFCSSRKSCDYGRLAKELNNSEFGKHLSLEHGTISWNGALTLRSTRAISNRSEILASRGHSYWTSCGFPTRGI